VKAAKAFVAANESPEGVKEGLRSFSKPRRSSSRHRSSRARGRGRRTVGRGRGRGLFGTGDPLDGIALGDLGLGPL
jgi:hypothetical protein